MLGRRILVNGPSGSGKSTLARRLGTALDLPVVELDALYHLPDWQEPPKEEFRAKVLAVVDGHAGGWVCDGNYSSVRRDLLPRADTVVWLRLPFRVVYARLFLRTMRRSWRRESLWGTNYETFGKAFFSRDSILLWGITHYREHFRNVERDLRAIEHNARVIELCSAREVDELLAAL